MKETNKTKYALLGVLSMGPCSGYDIKKFCDSSIAYFWNENYAHIYTVLREMEEEALVTGVEVQNAGRPVRKVYSITGAGEAELLAWLKRPVDPALSRNELLLKLFFSADIPGKSTIALLEDRRRQSEEELKLYDGINAMLAGDENPQFTKARPLWMATVNYGKLQAAACIRWCDETIAAVQAMDNESSREGFEHEDSGH